MHNYSDIRLVKAVAKQTVPCVEVSYLYTQVLYLLWPVHKTGGLYTTCSAFLKQLFHTIKLLFISITASLLHLIHTTYKDNQKLINLFSY